MQSASGDAMEVTRAECRERHVPRNAIECERQVPLDEPAEEGIGTGESGNELCAAAKY